MIQALVKKYPALEQGGKFIITGFINTGIDFGVLFLLVFLSGKDKGIYTLIFPAISFIFATINSFFMNKYWTFRAADRSSGTEKTAKDFSQFLFVTLIGLSINAGITYSLSNFVPPFLGISIGFLNGVLNQRVWVFFSKACATAVSLVWNFIGYKLWVFKK